MLPSVRKLSNSFSDKKQLDTVQLETRADPMNTELRKSKNRLEQIVSHKEATIASMSLNAGKFPYTSTNRASAGTLLEVLGEAAVGLG